MLAAISYQGGVATTIRMYIRIGEKKGTIDIQTAIGELGCRMISHIIIIGTTIGRMTNVCHCCASCSELTIELSAANSRA